MTTARSWHAVTWLTWAIAATLCVQLARSPVYVALVIAVAALVVSVHSLDSPFARAFPTLLWVGIAFAFLRTVLTVATTHGGPGSVLLTTPEFTLPRILGGFDVGGSVELTILLQSFVEGFVIVGVMAAFGAFNAVVSHYELVQATPRAFYELGLVIIVALAFVPSTVGAIHSVHEADRARTGGRVVRRGRLLRLIVPILETGMERAVALAESMDSRGFARTGPTTSDHIAGWCGFGALLALGASFVALVGRARPVALGLGVGGGALLAAAIVLAGSRTQRVRYRPRPLTSGDWALMGVSLAGPLTLAFLTLVGDSTLTWSVFPLRWPAFHALPALAIALLLAPLARRPATMGAPAPPSELQARIEEYA